jgi:hypothetical protein
LWRFFQNKPSIQLVGRSYHHLLPRWLKEPPAGFCFQPSHAPSIYSLHCSLSDCIKTCQSCQSSAQNLPVASSLTRRKDLNFPNDLPSSAWSHPKSLPPLLHWVFLL